MGAVRALRRKMLFFFREPAMSKPLLSPQGEFPAVGLGRRLAAMFYDFLLCTALLIVTAFLYKLVWIAFVGEAKMRTLTESGALDGDKIRIRAPKKPKVGGVQVPQGMTK